MHHLTPLRRQFMWSFLGDSDDFVLIGFRLLDHLWQYIYHLEVTNSFIDESRISDNTINSTTHQETMWAPRSIHILWDMILFLLPFKFLFDACSIYIFQLSLTLCWLENRPVKKSCWRSNWGKFLNWIKKFSFDIVMIILFLTIQLIQVCWRVYQFDDKQLMVSWTQNNWNIISSLLHQHSCTSLTSPSPHGHISNFNGAKTPCASPGHICFNIQQPGICTQNNFQSSQLQTIVLCSGLIPPFQIALTNESNLRDHSSAHFTSRRENCNMPLRKPPVTTKLLDFKTQT